MKKCKIRNILCEKIITKQDVLLIKAQKIMEKLIMEYCWLLDIEQLFQVLNLFYFYFL